MNKKFIELCFVAIMAMSSSDVLKFFVSCPDGVLAYSTLDSYDKTVQSLKTNNIFMMSELMSSGQITILEYGTVVKLILSTPLVAVVNVIGSSKIFAVPLKCLDRYSMVENEKK